MLIQPENIVALKELSVGDIAFPLINYGNLELNRLLILSKTTIHAAHTNISKDSSACKYIDDLDWVDGGDIGWQCQMLEIISNRIFELIQEWQSNGDMELLKKIFIYIQLWGGNSGRGMFLNGNGNFKGNYSENIYIDFVKLALDGDILSLGKLKSSAKGGISYIGTSFASKHLYFWSQGRLPIFDSIISKIVFGRVKPRVDDYFGYYRALLELKEYLLIEYCNVETTQIERTLFNWAQSDLGSLWIKTRIKKSICA